MNKFAKIISTNKNIFTNFNKVYLFGSCLSSEYPNDIDILLVYDKYSIEIEHKRMIIYLYLYEIWRLPIDIIMLSEQELEQTKFLEKLSTKYIKLSDIWNK